jgi:hypothetical protein
MAVLGVCALLALVLAVVGVVSLVDSLQDPVQTTAEALYREYETNLAAADAKYLGKKVELPNIIALLVDSHF